MGKPLEIHDALKKCPVFLLTVAGDKTASFVLRHLRRYKLDHRMLATIKVLSEDAVPRTQGALAQIVCTTANTMSSIVDRLEREGYAKRRRNDENRREWFVDLTHKGHNLADTLHQEIVTLYREMLPELAENEIEALLVLLRSYIESCINL